MLNRQSLRRLSALLTAIITAVSITMPIAAADNGDSSDTPQWRGQKTFSLYGGYTTRNESAAAGISFSYRFSRLIRLAPSAEYTFRHQREDGFDISLNLHVPMLQSRDGRFAAYPLAGVGYTEWSRKNVDVMLLTTTDVRSRTDRFGINVGAGVEYFATPTLRLAAEGVWRQRNDFNTGVFSVAIGYVF